MKEYFGLVMGIIPLDIPTRGSGPVRGVITADGPILDGISAAMPVKGV